MDQVSAKKIITVIRHPVRSLISEFNRRETGSHKLSLNVSDVVKFNSTSGSKFKTLAKRMLPEWHRLYVELINANSRVLILSYEDMQDNLLPQLLRIWNFLELDGSQSLERTFCSFLNREQNNFFKRKYTADFLPEVKFLIREIGIESLVQKLDNLLRSRHLHILRNYE